MVGKIVERTFYKNILYFYKIIIILRALQLYIKITKFISNNRKRIFLKLYQIQ